MYSPFDYLTSLLPNVSFFADLGSSAVQDDENQIISQMQVAWILFYNHFVAQGMNYTQARALTEQYYKLDIFTQMLPDFVTNPAYINDYLTPAFGTSPTGTYTISTPQVSGKFMPVEFSVGAYRFGHSLVRNVYHINSVNDAVGDANPDQVNVPIFDVNNFQTGDLSGGSPLEGPAQNTGNCTDPDQANELCSQATSHQIEWKYFFKTLNCGDAPAQALALAPGATSPTGPSCRSTTRRSTPPGRPRRRSARTSTTCPPRRSPAARTPPPIRPATARTR